MSKSIKISKWKFGSRFDKRKRLQEGGVNQFSDLPSRKSLKKAIIENRVLVNGKIGQTSTWVILGDQLELLPPISYKINPKFEGEKINVVYENDDLIIVVKRCGLTTNGINKLTLEKCVSKYLNNNNLKTAHRLDKDTHGLVILCKNIHAQNWIGRAFENRQIRKKYTALIQGELLANVIISRVHIDGKNSSSIIRKIESIDWPIHGRATLVVVEPISGRKHQIRKHLFQIGHPVVGDVLYHKNDRYRGSGLYLSCMELQLKDPKTNECIYAKVDLPKKFDKVMKRIDFAYLNNS